MNFRVKCAVGVLVSILLSAGSTFAQSNFDLQPPMQADLQSDQVRMSPDPDALPLYQFGVLSLGEKEAEIITSKPQQKLLAEVGTPEPPEGHVFYTENATQNYTVAVPYTEEVDGKKITRVRTETRTRTVPVRRTRKMTEEELAAEKKRKESGEKKEKPKKPVATQHRVSIPYTVEIPYTETNDDGETVQKIRKEVRTRTVQVLRGKTETTRQSQKSAYAFDKLSFFDPSGNPVDLETVKARAADERLPVIAIQSKDHIDPYFELILKPETLFVIVKKDE